MELHDYIRILRRSWRVIISLGLAGLLAGAAASYLVKPTYTADTQLFVAIQSTGSIEELQTGNSFTQARVQSYVRIVDTPIVLSPVIEDLSLNTTPNELAKKIRAENGLETVLVTISADAGTPKEAAAIAKAVGDSLISAVEELESTGPDENSPVSLSVVAPASPPNEPSAPNTELNLALGLLIGLVTGAGAAVLRSVLDTKIRGEADLRSVTDAPFLGGIAFDQDATKKPLVTQIGTQSPRAESFRHLRTNMQFANINGDSKAVVVTSSLPGEGKSTTAVNLAITLSQAGQSVALIDADLRRPMVSEYLGLERNAGLTTALVGKADIDDLLQPWGQDELYVLTSGQIPPNPSELLGSSMMTQLMRRLEHTFDAVVIDAPPLLPVTDAAVLSQHAGGVIMVVGSQTTTRIDLEKSLSTLEMVEANLLGLVLNRVPTKGPDAYAYSYHSYESHDQQTKGRSAPRSSPSAAVPSPVRHASRNQGRAVLDSFPSSRRSADPFDDQVLHGSTDAKAASTFHYDHDTRPR